MEHPIRQSSTKAFLFLGLQVIVLHTLSANCHERIFIDRNFKLPWFLTLLEFVFNAALAGGWRLAKGNFTLSRGFSTDHLYCAVVSLHIIAQHCTGTVLQRMSSFLCGTALYC